MDRYDRGGRRQSATSGRSVLGFWVPLVLTASAAAIGITAWIWNERAHDDSEEESNVTDSDRYVKDPRSNRLEYQDAALARKEGEASGSVVSRMSGALRRTPSPQQLYDGASKKLAAGAAAATAVAGSALAAIREEDKDEHLQYGAETAAGRSNSLSRTTDGAVSTSTSAVTSTQTSKSVSTLAKGARRKTAVIVVSSETDLDSLNDADEGLDPDQVSILSTLAPYIDNTVTRTFVLIYAPEVKNHPLSSQSKAHSSGDDEKPLESLDPRPINSPSSGVLTPRTPALSATGSAGFNILYGQALDLVEDDTMVMPFTTPMGHVPMLKQLQPNVVYLQESLSGPDGEVVSQLRGWVSQIGLVVGADGLTGGVVDSDDEVVRGNKPAQAWWMSGDRVGLGKGCEIVDGIRIGEDWMRRVEGRD